jgi:YD repeat-containing protein
VLDALRNDPALQNAMVSTYIHKPLVGVTSVTDPKGDTQTYEYDGFNRLKVVRDKEGNKLSENEYHYRPQN